nr:hypothetical protein [Deinococcus sp. Marseille-Q6407]
MAAAYLRDVYDGPFVKDFYALGRPGIYVRVLRPGRLQAGDTGWLEPGDASAPTLAELMETHKHPARANAAFWQRALLSLLSHRMREEVGERLSTLG